MVNGIGDALALVREGLSRSLRERLPATVQADLNIRCRGGTSFWNVGGRNGDEWDHRERENNERPSDHDNPPLIQDTQSHVMFIPWIHEVNPTGAAAPESTRVAGRPVPVSSPRLSRLFALGIKSP